MKTGLLLLLALAAAAGCQGAPPSGADVRVPLPTAAASSDTAAPSAPVWPAAEDPAPAVAACLSGDAAACALAAGLYHDGWGVARDMTKVAQYGAMACKAGLSGACALRDLARFDDAGATLPAGLAAYRMYLKSFEGEGGPPWCTQLKATDAWGYAAYNASNCHLAEAQATLQPTRVPAGFERAAVAAACFDKAEAAACQGMLISTAPGEVDGKRLAPLCRDRGIGCGAAVGSAPAETLEFRRKACLSKEYEACSAWLLAAEKQGIGPGPLERERLFAQVCLHPAKDGVPRSVDAAGLDEHSPCTVASFPALAASGEAADRALVTALGGAPGGEHGAIPRNQGAP